jgi:hypothetical protein
MLPSICGVEDKYFSLMFNISTSIIHIPTSKNPLKPVVGDVAIPFHYLVSNIFIMARNHGHDLFYSILPP